MTNASRKVTVIVTVGQQACLRTMTVCERRFVPIEHADKLKEAFDQAGDEKSSLVKVVKIPKVKSVVFGVACAVCDQEFAISK